MPFIRGQYELPFNVFKIPVAIENYLAEANKKD